MGLLHSLAFPKQEDKQENPILDVEEVLAEVAWDTYVRSYGWFRRQFIKRKNFVIEVPMNFYHFEQGKVDLKPLASAQTTTESSADTGVSRGLDTLEVIGLQTGFNNDTNNEQKYNFNFQKERTASVEVTYQRGYSIGGKANFTIGIPKILGDGNIGVEIETYVEVTKATGERHEEKVTTSATSEITVAAHSHYVATVVMEERTLMAKFEVPVTMKLPGDEGLVYIKVKQTGEVVYIQHVTDLPLFFKCYTKNWEKGLSEGKEAKRKLAYLSANGEEVEDPTKWLPANDPDRAVAVRFIIEGIIKGVQLSSHCINLKQTEVLAGNATLAASPQNGKATGTAWGPSVKRVAASSHSPLGSSTDQTRLSRQGADRLHQVPPDELSSHIEGVTHSIEQRARDYVSKHVPAEPFQS